MGRGQNLWYVNVQRTESVVLQVSHIWQLLFHRDTVCIG